MEENQQIPTEIGSELKPSFWAKYQRSIWIGLISLAVLVSGLLVYLLFFRATAPKEPQGDIQIQIDAPSQLPSGSEASYSIKIKNSSNTAATGMVLETFYPAGFEFIDSTPDPKSLEGRQFELADLKPNEEKTLVIVGRLEGGLQEIKTLNVKLHYVPQNFRSEFTAVAQAQTEMLAADLSLELIVAPQVVFGQTIDYEIRVANVSTQSFAGLVVRMRYPEKFILKSAQPLPDERGEWPVDALGVGMSFVIRVSGKIEGEDGQDSAAIAELLLKDAEGNLTSSHKSVAFTTILPSPLLLEQRLLGQSETVAIGQTLNYEVSYQNRSEVGLTNVQIALIAEAPAAANLQISAARAVVKDNKISWLPATESSLAVVSPGMNGKFNFAITVTEKLLQSLQKNPVLRTRLEFVSSELADPIATSPLELKIRTKISLSANVRALGGNSYRVEIFFNNTVNDVSDLELTAKIADPTSVIDLSSLSPTDEKENVTWTPVAGLLRWRVGSVFPFSGSFHSPRTISFDAVSAGPLIFSDVQAVGKDQFTAEEVSASLGGI